MKNRSKNKAQQAPKPKPMQSPMRRHSDVVLARALDAHMQDSLSDIAELWQRLSARLGAKTMQYREYVPSSSTPSDKQLIDTVSRLVQWRKACDKRKLRSGTVMLLVTDGMTFSSIARQLKLHRHCIRAHIRACLTVWSFWNKRCNAKELAIQYDAFIACCK